MRVNMRVERARKNLSQKAVSELLGCNVNQVSRWEQGVTKPSAEYLAKLSDLFEVNPSYLLEEVEKCDK